MRMLINLVITVLSNALGLLIAAALLPRDTVTNADGTTSLAGDGMSLPANGFLIALAIFTVAMFLVRPAIQKAALKYANVLGGSSALLATLAALIITSVFGNLVIRGAVTWVLATVIIWVVSMIGAVLFPWLLARRALAKARNAAGPAVPARR